MRSTILLLTLIVAGCQSISPVHLWLDRPAPSVMPLWGIYQHCMATTDTETLLQWLNQLDQAAAKGSEPPDWLKSWDESIAEQPVRASVDPRALAAACTIHTAALLAEQNRFAEARSLYENVASRYASAEWSFYRRRANEGLDSLSKADRALVTQRTLIPRSLSH